MGLDPATISFGLGVVDVVGNSQRFVDAFSLCAKAGHQRWTRLHEIHADLVEAIAEFVPDKVAIEGGVDKYATSTMAGGEARGIVLAVLFAAGVPPTALVEVPPATVKKLVAGRGDASKEDVARAVRLRLRCPPMGLDESDAIAIALAGVALSRRA